MDRFFATILRRVDLDHLMLIFGGGSWSEHHRWFYFTAVASLAAAVWYGLECRTAGRLLGGGSIPGLTFGIAGGAIIVFEMLLWLRKKFRAVRIGRAKLWMKAHLWLGILCLPLLILHSGFRWWGGSLAAALMVLLVVVVVSGVWGLVLQNIIPKMMLDQIPAETIRSQIGHILSQYLEEAERAVRATCGRAAAEPVSVGPAREGAERERSFLVVGATRNSGAVQGKYFQTSSQARLVPNSEPLFLFFETLVAPYLRAKNGSRLSLASSKRASVRFQELRTELDPAAKNVVDMLEELCDQRRQFDLQAKLHAWLHAWLCVHLPLSAALFVLMFAHIYYAIKFY